MEFGDNSFDQFQHGRGCDVKYSICKQFASCYGSRCFDGQLREWDFGIGLLYIDVGSFGGCHWWLRREPWSARAIRNLSGSDFVGPAADAERPECGVRVAAGGL